MKEADFNAHPELTLPGAPSLSSRNALFSREALPLGLEAAQRALRQWGCPASHVTHLLVSSMTSMHMPGLDLQVAKALALPRCVHRTLLQMTGCHAGVQMMRMAMDICQATRSRSRGSSNGTHTSSSSSSSSMRGACVLLVAVEVPSISLQAPAEDSPSLGNLVSAAIFGDGAAAMVVTSTDCTEARQGQGQGGGREGERERETGNEAFWALHPGGRAIVDAVERHCNLPPHALAASR